MRFKQKHNLTKKNLVKPSIKFSHHNYCLDFSIDLAPIGTEFALTERLHLADGLFFRVVAVRYTIRHTVI